MHYGGRLGEVLNIMPNPVCGKCGSIQVRLVDWMTNDVKYKCRRCGERWSVKMNKTETKLKQRSKRKSISKAKFWRVLNYLFCENEKVESDSGCVIAVWAETETHIYYFDPKRKLYFRDVL